MKGAVASSAARATSVSPGTGVNPAPDIVFAVAVKLVPEKATAARFSTNEDCCTRKNPPLTHTACPAAAGQRWDQLVVSVIELALVACTQPPCSVTVRVSSC